MTLNFNKHFQVKLGARARARDLWKHSDLGEFTDSIPIKDIPAHGVVVLRVFDIEKYVLRSKKKKGSFKSDL